VTRFAPREEPCASACVPAAAIVASGRRCSAGEETSCARALYRPPSSLAAALHHSREDVRVPALFRGRRCLWRPRWHRSRVRAALGGRLFSVPAAGTRPFLEEAAAGGGQPHLFGGRFVRKQPPFPGCPRGPLREVGDLRQGARVSGCAVTGRCGSMVHPAPRPISKTERRRGLRQFCRMCRRTLGVADENPLCAPSGPCPWAARTQPI